MKLSFKKIDIWKVLYVYLIFQPSLPDLISNSFLNSVITYSDEAISLCLLALVLAINKFEVHLLKFERRMLLFTIIFELVGIFADLAGISPEKKLDEITKVERKTLLNLLKKYQNKQKLLLIQSQLI